MLKVACGDNYVNIGRLGVVADSVRWPTRYGTTLVVVYGTSRYVQKEHAAGGGAERGYLVIHKYYALRCF